MPAMQRKPTLINGKPTSTIVHDRSFAGPRKVIRNVRSTIENLLTSLGGCAISLFDKSQTSRHLGTTKAEIPDDI